MKLSIVTSLYGSEPYIEEFQRRVRAVAAEISDDCEFIYVNDGSPDGALELLIRLRQEDHRITIIDLSRNFGHHRALMVGLSFAEGDLVFMIDVDLEEEPELLTVFHNCLLERRADSIYGVQHQRKGGFFERLSGSLFYRLSNFLSGADAPENTLVARLMTRRFVSALLQYQEHEIDIANLLHMTGYLQIPILVHKHSKPETSYTLMRKLRLALRSITASSRRPLILISVLGGLILFVTIAVISYYLIAFAVSRVVPSGYTSLILSLWLLGGLTIFSVGIVALYIAVIFTEVKARPSAIIRDVYRRGESNL
jgi:putative glycosyltransferase